MMKKKNRKSIIKFILAGLVVCMLLISARKEANAATGYTDHAHVWSHSSNTSNSYGSSDCGGCKAVAGKTDCTKCSHTGKEKCTTCVGGGITSSTSGTHTNGTPKSVITKGCTSCGGSGTQTVNYDSSGNKTSTSGSYTKGSGKVKCTTCGGDGALNSTCSRCSGQGWNYFCTRSGCAYHKDVGGWKYWTKQSNYNTVCYTTENQYSIVFRGNGATGGSTSNLNGCYYDNAYTLTANGYTRKGYTFKGWSTSSTATTATYADKASVSKLSTVNGATVTLYAVWQANTYTIVYDANGGVDAPEDTSFVFDTTAYISKDMPARMGYTFDGWWAMHTAGTMLLPGDEVPNGWSDFTLQAQWTPNSYTTTFIPNGGSFKNSRGENIETVTMTYDTKDFCDMSYGIIERKGFTFKGWYTEIEGGIQVYDAENKATNEGTYFQNNIWRYADDVTLYAQWVGVPHTVTYDANGGTTPSREFVKYFDDVLDLSLTAEKPGYIFAGWNTSPNAMTGLSNIKMQEEDITLYAIYSIAVSDIANHLYNENGLHIYNQLKDEEVFLRVWELGNEENYQDYPLRYEFDVSTMVYRYVIDAEVSDFVENVKNYSYAVYAYDNAGNWTPIIADTTPPAPQKYFQQTVRHYRYDCIIGEYIHFATTVEEVKAGESYKPLFITNLSGYQAEKMEYPNGYIIAENGSYIVAASATTKAYYKPNEYTLTFDANGGTTSVTSKIVRYGDYYGDMPTPTKTGYTFMGWYTEKEGGDIVSSSDKYLKEGDSTLYAHWSINSYTVTYDYWTNGGTGVSAVSKQQTFDTMVDLSVTAVKLGWTHIGWNTNPDAVTPLENFRMSADNLTLYAVYKKDMTATFIDSYPARSTEIKVAIYNRQESQDIAIPAQTVMDGWISNGWTTAFEADRQAEYTAGGNYELSNSITFYALYEKAVNLTYDTNGSAQTYPEVSGNRYYNASGNWKNPSFLVSDAPTREQYSFVQWSVNGTVVNMAGTQITQCIPGDEIFLESNVTLKALWDAYPEIEAYDRYFTLDEAKSGAITEERLLDKVKGTDAEDGELLNGVSVLVKDYEASVFESITEDTTVEVTYLAMDSFGNMVAKPVTIHIVDTTIKKSSKLRYIRFISKSFFEDEDGNLIPECAGGLEETSVWRIKEVYLNLLRNTLYRKVADVETWVFTRKDIEEIKKKL